MAAFGVRRLAAAFSTIRVQTLDEKLLEAFMKGFYGYGTWGAKYWFVGLEEGGGQSAEEVGRRLRTWDQRGRTEIDDICEFHRDAELTDWFGDGASPQSTWTPLILTVLIAEGRSADFRSILQYQKTQLGTTNGETAIIETLPLPSPGKDDWRYGEWSSMSALKTRPSYRRAFLKPRSDHIAELITALTPKVVVFYGDRARWSQRFRLSAQRGTYRTDVGYWGDTLVIATGHPNARTNDTYPRFTAIGEYIRQQLQNQQAET